MYHVSYVYHVQTLAFLQQLELQKSKVLTSLQPLTEIRNQITAFRQLKNVQLHLLLEQLQNLSM
jgi:hypothetical protein